MPSFTRVNSHLKVGSHRELVNIPLHAPTRKPEMSPVISCEIKYNPVLDLWLPLPGRER